MTNHDTPHLPGIPFLSDPRAYWCARPPVESPRDPWAPCKDPDGQLRDRLIDPNERARYLDGVGGILEFLQSLEGRGERRVILDVGCGPGWLLEELEDPCWDRYGCEPSDRCFEHMRRVNESETWKSPGWTYCFYPLEEMTWPEDRERCDVVVMNHVIEHMVDPMGAMEKVRRLMASGGWLVLGTPDFDSVCARLWGDRYRMLHDETHVSLFSCESMHRFLRAHNFRVMYVDFPYDWEKELRLSKTEMMYNAAVGNKMPPEWWSPAWPGNWMTFYARRI